MPAHTPKKVRANVKKEIRAGKKPSVAKAIAKTKARRARSRK